MTYYKIVTDDLKSFIKSIGYKWMSKYWTQYIVGEYVQPTNKNTKLFAFSTLEQVLNFLCREGMYDYIKIGRLKVYECEIKNPTKITMIGNTHEGPENFDNFWLGSDLVVTKKIPSGTIACDEICLTKEVENVYELL